MISKQPRQSICPRLGLNRDYETSKHLCALHLMLYPCHSPHHIPLSPHRYDHQLGVSTMKFGSQLLTFGLVVDQEAGVEVLLSVAK